MNSLHCFAGIGGGLLADRHLGHTPIATVEISAACRKVLAMRWPDATHYGDINEFNNGMAEDYTGRVDLVCGGWPCQSISVAGKQGGMEYGSGTKSSLAFEFLRTIHRVRPRLVFAENVANVLAPRHRKGLEQMLGELSHMGYGGGYLLNTARSAGGYHIRKRFWLMAEKGRTGWANFGLVDSNGRSTPMLPTPVVSGGGTTVFVRKDGKVRDDLETTLFMREIVNELGINFRDISPEDARYRLDGKRLSAGFVERLMRFPVGYSDIWVPQVDLDLPPPTPTYEQFMAFGPLVKARKNDGRASRIKQLGNAQDTWQAVCAYKELSHLLQIPIK